MLGMLRQPYLFAIALAVVTAVLAFALSKVTDKDSTKSRRTFFTTLAAGLVTGIALTYLTAPKGVAEAAIATEPFDAIPGTVPVGI